MYIPGQLINGQPKEIKILYYPFYPNFGIWFINSHLVAWYYFSFFTNTFYMIPSIRYQSNTMLMQLLQNTVINELLHIRYICMYMYTHMIGVKN